MEWGAYILGTSGSNPKKKWLAAASQIFYSLGIGWGTLPAFASYNSHHHNFTRDAWVVPLINCGTSFLMQ